MKNKKVNIKKLKKGYPDFCLANKLLSKSKELFYTCIRKGFDGGYEVYFTIGVQSFHLPEKKTKKEAKWHEKMLQIALKNLQDNYKTKMLNKMREEEQANKKNYYLPIK